MTTARHTWSAAKSKISFAITGLPGSPLWLATGIVFWRVWRPKLSRPKGLSRRGLLSLQDRSLLPLWWKRWNTAFRKSTRLARCSWVRVPRIRALNLPSIFYFDMVSGPAWSTPGAATSTKHALCPTPICRRTFPSQIWAVTVMQSSASRAMNSRLSSFVFLARSSVASAPMGGTAVSQHSSSQPVAQRGNAQTRLADS